MQLNDIHLSGAIFSLITATTFGFAILGSSSAATHSVTDSATHPGSSAIRLAQSPTPVTYITEPGDPDELVIQITEGEFRYHGWLKRTTGNSFVGEDQQVRVMYDRDTGRIVVINVKTGDEYYNYGVAEFEYELLRWQSLAAP